MSQPLVLDRLPPTPARDAVLTLEQLAAVLQMSPDMVAALNVPAIPTGRGKRPRYRYIYGQVLDALAKRAE